MAFTLAKRVDIVKSLLGLFEEVVEVKDQMLRMNVQLSRDLVWQADFAIRPAQYMKTATLTDADNLPSDYVLPTYNVYKSTTPYTYTTVEAIGEVTTNPFVKATTDFPHWYIADQKFNTLPTAITGVTFEYYWRPAPLFATDNSIADTVDDSMPADTERKIIRGAVELTLELLLSKQAAMELMQKRAQQYSEAADKFFADHFRSANIQPQSL